MARRRTRKRPMPADCIAEAVRQHLAGQRQVKAELERLTDEALHASRVAVTERVVAMLWRGEDIGAIVTVCRVRLRDVLKLKPVVDQAREKPRSDKICYRYTQRSVSEMEAAAVAEKAATAEHFGQFGGVPTQDEAELPSAEHNRRRRVARPSLFSKTKDDGK